MRNLILFFCFAALAAPAQAQTLARVEVSATVRVPDFLSMRVAETAEPGPNVRNVTVYVTANRGWQLSVTNACAGCTVRMESLDAYGSTLLGGDNGNDIPVTIEYEWPEGTDPTQIQYVLIPA